MKKQELVDLGNGTCVMDLDCGPRWYLIMSFKSLELVSSYFCNDNSYNSVHQWALSSAKAVFIPSHILSLICTILHNRHNFLIKELKLKGCFSGISGHGLKQDQ